MKHQTSDQMQPGFGENRRRKRGPLGELIHEVEEIVEKVVEDLLGFRHHHHRHGLARVSLWLHHPNQKGGECEMVLSTTLGSTVFFDVIGHSALDGEPLPDGSDVKLTSNAPEVATIPPTVSVPAGGGNIVNNPGIVIVAIGSTDMSVSVSPKDGTGPFVDTGTLLVTPLPTPGLVRVELVLHN